MVQTEVAGSAIKRPSGGSRAVNTPGSAAMGAADRIKGFHSILPVGAKPVARDLATSAGVGGGVKSAGSWVSKGCSGALETLICGALQAGQNVICSSIRHPQR